uniref:Uncharacterized protein n=1 Tax=Strigamia maritima TaxID=126957 RepID=T1IU49_STRMM
MVMVKHLLEVMGEMVMVKHLLEVMEEMIMDNQLLTNLHPATETMDTVQTLLPVMASAVSYGANGSQSSSSSSYTVNVGSNGAQQSSNKY